jgi:hypothetical protein
MLTPAAFGCGHERFQAIPFIVSEISIVGPTVVHVDRLRDNPFKCALKGYREFCRKRRRHKITAAPPSAAACGAAYATILMVSWTCESFTSIIARTFRFRARRNTPILAS